MNKPLLYLLLFVILFSSCRDLVQDEFPYREPQAVVNGIFVADSLIKVQVSTSAELGPDPLSVIENAQVNLFVNDAFVEALSHDSAGIYVSTIRAQAENKYRCEVEIPNLPLAIGSDSMPVGMPIVAIEHIKEAGKDQEGYTYPAVKLTFKNEPDRLLYFEALLYDPSSKYGGNIPIHTFDDPLIQFEGLPIALFTNELIEGDEYSMILNYTENGRTKINGVWYTIFDPIVVHLRTVSPEYYQYRKQLYLYEEGRHPSYAGGVSQVFPLYNNIENGYGIFSAYALSVSDTLKPEQPW